MHPISLRPDSLLFVHPSTGSWPKTTYSPEPSSLCSIRSWHRMPLSHSSFVPSRVAIDPSYNSMKHPNSCKNNLFQNLFMLNVVITGSTKGVGYAMAREFLRSNDSVVICSRSKENLDNALQALEQQILSPSSLSSSSSSSPSPKLYGVVCDVSDPASVENLANFAIQSMSRIDLWINNAGSVAFKRRPISQLSPDDLKTVVDTNLLGSLLCCRQAYITMTSAQSPPGGHVFNMDGAGVSGNPTPGFIAYGATKRAIPQLTSTLRAEARQKMSQTSVGFHCLSPGLVLTDLLLRDVGDPKAKQFFNFIAEEPETVAKYLVPRIRAVKGTGKYIRFLTIPMALLQIAAGFLLGIRKNRYFDKDGNRIDSMDRVYDASGVRDITKSPLD